MRGVSMAEVAEFEDLFYAFLPTATPEEFAALNALALRLMRVQTDEDAEAVRAKMRSLLTRGAGELE